MLLCDYEKMSPSKFSFDNSVFRCGIPQPMRFCHDVDGPLVDKGWQVIGWCDTLYGFLAKEDCIAVMLFHSEEGEVWQHYPSVALECEVTMKA